MKVFISVDMEGIVGMESRADAYSENPGYKQAREFMTAETNAAVQACVEAGYKDIRVVDGHAERNNIIKDKLDRNATLITRSSRLAMMTGIEEDNLVVFLGYHGRAGSGSFCAHTNSSKLIKSLKINNKEVSEGITNALIAKSFNSKLIFISGTDMAIKEIKEVMPNLPAVVSMKSLDVENSKSFPVEDHLANIKQGIKDALKNKDNIRFIDHPITNLDFEVNLNTQYPKEIESLSEDKKTIKFKADIIEGYKKYREILRNLN